MLINYHVSFHLVNLHICFYLHNPLAYNILHYYFSIILVDALNNHSTLR